MVYRSKRNSGGESIDEMFAETWEYVLCAREEHRVLGFNSRPPSAGRWNPELPACEGTVATATNNSSETAAIGVFFSDGKIPVVL
jgi:hypothetical protein